MLGEPSDGPHVLLRHYPTACNIPARLLSLLPVARVPRVQRRGVSETQSKYWYDTYRVQVSSSSAGFYFAAQERSFPGTCGSIVVLGNVAGEHNMASLAYGIYGI